MEDITVRINQLLSALGISKTKFARDLGITNASVSTMCSGKTRPSSQTIVLICKEYGVSEDWLRNGTGDMFVRKTRNDRIDDLIDRVRTEPEGSVKVRILTLLSRLSNEQWALLDDMLDMLLEDRTTADGSDPVAAAEAAYEKRFLAATEEKSSASNTSEDIQAGTDKRVG